MSLDVHQIKDFNTYYLSKEIPVPDDFPQLSPSGKKIMHLSKVREVLTKSEGTAFLQDIRNSRKFMPSFKFPGGKRDFYISPTIDYYSVKFNDEGKIEKNLLTDSNYTKQPPSIQKTMISIIERLAKELNWKNTTQCLACNAVDYYFSANSRAPLQWHDDGFYCPTKYSFIVLLSDPDDAQTGWEEGSFLYTTARVVDRTKTTFEERAIVDRMSSQTEGEILNEPNSPVWKIHPTLNDGILFGNLGMRHKITPMIPKKDQGSRMIFTVFAFGTPEEVKQNAYSSN